MLSTKQKYRSLPILMINPHTYFAIKILDNIQPGTDQRKSVGLVVTDSELAPKLKVQWPWRPVTTLAEQLYIAGCRTRAGISLI